MRKASPSISVPDQAATIVIRACSKTRERLCGSIPTLQESLQMAYTGASANSLCAHLNDRHHLRQVLSSELSVVYLSTVKRMHIIVFEIQAELAPYYQRVALTYGI